MSYFTKTILASFVISFFLIAVLISFFKLTDKPTSLHPDRPIVFYEKSVITGFDASGNPYGQSHIVRQDGPAGNPRIIYSYPSIKYLDAYPGARLKGETIVLDYPEKFEENPVSNNPVAVTETIDLNGKSLMRDTITYGTLYNPENQKITSMGGSRIAQSRGVCENPPDEGPCHEDFMIEFLQSDRVQATVTGTLLNISNPGGKTADLIGFSPTVNTFYYRVREQQEAGYDSIWSFNLDTKGNTVLWKNNQPSTSMVDVTLTAIARPDDWTRLGSASQPQIIDNEAFFLRHNWETNKTTIVQFSLRDGTLTEKFDVREPLLNDVYVDPTGAYFLIKLGTDNVYRIVDIKQQNLGTLPSTIRIAGWSQDGTYLATEDDPADISRDTNHKYGRVRQFPLGDWFLVFTQTVSTRRGALEKDGKNSADPEVGSTLYHLLGVY